MREASLSRPVPGMPKRSLIAATVKRVPGREYLAASNQANLTIKRSRHRAVREIAAKCPRTLEPPTHRYAGIAETVFGSGDCPTEVKTCTGCRKQSSETHH
ncbi:MAG: hypothetical protein QOH31_3129 [Verrucomicrobiota bacterium]|jgi:hypothetical protein